MTTISKKSKAETAPTLRDRADSLRARVPAHGPSSDPVLAVIRDGRALLAAFQKSRRLPDVPNANGFRVRPAAEKEVVVMLLAHLRGPLLQAAPTTVVGGIALAKYAAELSSTLDYDMADEAAQILTLVAQVPLA